MAEEREYIIFITADGLGAYALPAFKNHPMRGKARLLEKYTGTFEDALKRAAELEKELGLPGDARNKEEEVAVPEKKKAASSGRKQKKTYDRIRGQAELDF